MDCFDFTEPAKQSIQTLFFLLNICMYGYHRIIAFGLGESHYPYVEKVALALVTMVRKLRPYFQFHTIIVLTNQLLR